MDIFDHYKTELRKIAPLTEEDCTLFQPYLTVKKIKKNDFFVQEGQVSDEVGFISTGLFRMYYLQDGKEINTYFFFENNFVVSYQSFLTRQPSRYAIQALEDSEIIYFNYTAMNKAYAISHNWERFGRTVAEYSYINATQRTESFLFLNGEQRYLELLSTRPEIFERIPLYHIASYLGIERESLSRLRKKITKQS
jgi:CRP/FNR family transcriptional regulator, anaerobic regulatory protein